MQIGIIGAGNIGATLATKLVRLGHHVTIANSRGPDTLRALAAASGARAGTAIQAAQAVDVVVLAVPQMSVLRLAADLGAHIAAGTVVIDTGNYYPEARDGQIEEIDAGLTESEWVAKRLGRRVVKAFNNIAHTSLRDGGKPASTPERIALSIAGDRAADKAVVLELIDALGFDGLDSGALSESWRQQPGTPAYCFDLDTERLQQALNAAERGRIHEYRREAEDMVKRLSAQA